MATVTAPIMTDATGQSIDSKLNSLLGKMDNLAAAFQPNASGIVYSNTTSGLTGDDVQEAIDEMAADVSEINQSLSDLDERLVNTRLICNSSGYFPLNSGDTPPYNRGQITVITRNRNTGAIYALWYDNSVTGFRVGAVISGSNPSQGNTVDIQYLG